MAGAVTFTTNSSSLTSSSSEDSSEELSSESAGFAFPLATALGFTYIIGGKRWRLGRLFAIRISDNSFLQVKNTKIQHTQCTGESYFSLVHWCTYHYVRRTSLGLYILVTASSSSYDF